MIDHPPDRKAERTAERLIAMLAQVPAPLRETLAFDKGSEFALHYRLQEKLGMQTYFCDPRAPWQKGGVENAIGRPDCRRSGEGRNPRQAKGRSVCPPWMQGALVAFVGLTLRKYGARASSPAGGERAGPRIAFGVRGGGARSS